MAHALRLARKGLFSVRINPRVGCVIANRGGIIASGYHARYGQPHAEINALHNAPEDINGATIYVTLEPCAHQGNTPACAPVLAAAKVARVVAAMQDPNPLVNGKGLAYLRQHGIKTSCNVLASEAAELNQGFIKRMTLKRPYVTLKSAISLDGKTALATGESKWITNEHARLDVHRLRARSCAILTGVNTILHDNPQLTVRLSKTGLGTDLPPEPPARVIIDTHLRTSPSAEILRPAGQVIIYTCCGHTEKIQALRARNAEVLEIKPAGKHVNLTDVMQDLAHRGINEILVEAGATLAGSLLEDQLVDQLIIYMAPHLLGHTSRGLVKLPAINTMQDRIDLQIANVKFVGNAIKIQAKPIY